MSVYKDQAVIVAVGTEGCSNVVAALGDKARETFEDHGSYVADLGMREDDRPYDAGIHVWEGQIEERVLEEGEAGEALESELTWDGTWRPACLEDFRRFGLAVPE